MFWALIAALVCVVAAIIAVAMLRGTGKDAKANQFDVAVYRNQLAEVDQDLARGVLSAEEAQRTKTEISRRLLAADAREATTGKDVPQAANRAVTVLVALALIGGALGIYASMGAPGYGDMSLKDRKQFAEQLRATRPSQAEQEAKLPAYAPPPEATPAYLDLVEKLRAAVKERPNDLKGHELLVTHESNLGNFVAAHQAQARVLTLKSALADAQDYLSHAGLQIQAAGGYVSPEAEASLQRLLEKDPRNGAGRYYLGQMLVQTGRPDLAFRMWEQLLRESPPNAPWVPLIRAEIATLAELAGVRYTLPPAAAADAPGPSAEDVEAAQSMTAEERQEMIRGMVAQLSDRLATEGGSPEEWARLIGAYGVLEERGKAQEIYKEALQVFAEDEQALALIRAGAERAGLLQ